MFLAGATVPGGYYLDRDELDVIAVSSKDGPLPGPAGRRYVRIPTWAVLTLAPLLGGIFVALMPLLRLFLVMRKLGLPSLAATTARARRLVSGLRPGRRG